MGRRNEVLFFVVVLSVVIAGSTACMSTKGLPVIEGKEVVAVVNGEPITRGEYEQEIGSLHAGKLEGKDGDVETAAGNQASQKKPGLIDYAGLLKRMVDVRLIVQESKRIGLDELPEYRDAKEKYAGAALRSLLMKQVLKDVTPDAKVVDEYYQQAAREWKLTSILFSKEEDAMRLAAEVSKGGDFDDLVHKAVADRKARGGRYDEYQPGNDILPPIYDALLTMGTASVSPVIRVPGGYALVKVEDFRLQETQEKKDGAVERALQKKKTEVQQEYIASLQKKLATTDRTLLESLDFDVSVDVFKLMTKDDRVITEITGGERITVADLADAMEGKYFHGVEGQIKKRTKSLNITRDEVFEQLVEKKVLVQEARATGIDQTDTYAELMKSFENVQIFGLFLRKVVQPEVKVDEAEMKAYYDDHRSDYTSPERMRLDGIVFKKREDAEEAMRKLRAGDQFAWIKANAEGQVAGDAPGLLDLGGAVHIVPTQNEQLRNALSGAGAGDYRLYESPEGYFYVLSVIAVFPPVVDDYAAVKPFIARRLFNERLQAGLEDWVAKLRSAAEVKVYVN